MHRTERFTASVASANPCTSLPAELAGDVGKGVGKEGEIQDVLWQELFDEAALGVAQVVMERFCRDGLVPGLPLGEADEGGRADALQDVVGVGAEALVGADEEIGRAHV